MKRKNVKEAIMNDRLEELAQALSRAETILQQDTNDPHQLKPGERMRSIGNVLERTKDRINAEGVSLDLGTGFGYGAVANSIIGFESLGVDNVDHKLPQARKLFGEVGVDLDIRDTMTFSNTPGLLHADVSTIKPPQKAKLITAFYLSGQCINSFFPAIEAVLDEDGCAVLSTEAEIDAVEQHLKIHAGCVSGFEIELRKIPGNFEQTAIILSK